MVDNVTLEKIRFGVHAHISKHINEARVDIVEILNDMFTVEVKGFVWGEKVDRIVMFEYPATWWQMFKQQYFPEWILERFPVRMQRKYADIYALYPDLKLDVADKRSLKNYNFSVFWKDVDENEE